MHPSVIKCHFPFLENVCLTGLSNTEENASLSELKELRRECLSHRVKEYRSKCRSYMVKVHRKECRSYKPETNFIGLRNIHVEKNIDVTGLRNTEEYANLRSVEEIITSCSCQQWLFLKAKKNI